MINISVNACTYVSVNKNKTAGMIHTKVLTGLSLGDNIIFFIVHFVFYQIVIRKHCICCEEPKGIIKHKDVRFSLPNQTSVATPARSSTARDQSRCRCVCDHGRFCL